MKGFLKSERRKREKRETKRRIRDEKIYIFIKETLTRLVFGGKGRT
jgi:hypothetical protein